MYLTLTVPRAMENEPFHEKTCLSGFELVHVGLKTLGVASGSINLKANNNVGCTCLFLHTLRHTVTTG